MAFKTNPVILGALNIWRRVNERRLWGLIAFTVSGVIAITAWLAYPFTGPYVRVPAAAFSLSSSAAYCVPVQLDISLVTSYAEVQDARITPIHSIRTENRVGSFYRMPVKLLEVGQQRRYLALLSDADRAKAVDQVERAKISAWNATLYISRLPAVDIRSIDVTYATSNASQVCPKESLAGSALQSRLVGTSSKLMYFSLMQDRLSDVVLAVNEVAGNVFLCVLLLAVLWLVNYLAVGLKLVYWTTDEQLVERTAYASRDSIEIARTDVHDQHRVIFSRLAFLRVIGPATGFLLTVASLVAGLHPSATASQDTFRFMSSLQLALVATLLGLAMRVMAEFAIRLHRGAAERKLGVIAAAEKALEK